MYGTSRDAHFLVASDEGLPHAAGLIELWRSGLVEPAIPPPLPPHIITRRLAAPDRVDPDDPPHPLLEPSGLRPEDRDQPGGMQLVEGPNLVRHRGRWILLHGVGDYHLAGYKLGVACSARLIPPAGARYREVLRRDERRVRGERGSPVEVVYVPQSQEADRPNYCGDLVVGPGAGSNVHLEDGPWLLFHGHRPSDARRRPEERLVFKLPIWIDIRGQAPTPDWLTVERPVRGAGRRAEAPDAVALRVRARPPS